MGRFCYNRSSNPRRPDRHTKRHKSPLPEILRNRDRHRNSQYRFQTNGNRQCHFHLRFRLQQGLLLFLLFGLLHHLAHRTRMVSVEGLFSRFRNGFGLGKAYQHVSPCECLQQSQVTAEGDKQCPYQQPMTGAAHPLRHQGRPYQSSNQINPISKYAECFNDGHHELSSSSTVDNKHQSLAHETSCRGNDTH